MTARPPGSGDGDVSNLAAGVAAAALAGVREAQVLARRSSKLRAHEPAGEPLTSVDHSERGDART
ncbi:MAG: hypothetical protein VX015_10015 [Planctomycetota bacterium]|nr:hypothetical protein [Planctomycetota bacterium]MEC8512469.1 hypothetical protein [Planctomycetota bacterium]